MLDKTSVEIVNTNVTLDDLQEMVIDGRVITMNEGVILNMKYVVSIKQIK